MASPHIIDGMGLRSVPNLELLATALMEMGLSAGVSAIV